jgi:hypothetical protein
VQYLPNVIKYFDEETRRQIREAKWIDSGVGVRTSDFKCPLGFHPMVKANAPQPGAFVNDLGIPQYALEVRDFIIDWDHFMISILDLQLIFAEDR